MGLKWTCEFILAKMIKCIKNLLEKIVFLLDKKEPLNKKALVLLFWLDQGAGKILLTTQIWTWVFEVT